MVVYVNTTLSPSRVRRGRMSNRTGRCDQCEAARPDAFSVVLVFSGEYWIRPGWRRRPDLWKADARQSRSVLERDKNTCSIYESPIIFNASPGSTSCASFPSFDKISKYPFLSPARLQACVGGLNVAYPSLRSIDRA